MTHTTSKQELFVTLVTTVNYCHMEIYCRHYWGPRYASETSCYQKFEMRICKIMLKATKIEGNNFPGGNFLGGIFPDTLCTLLILERINFAKQPNKKEKGYARENQKQPFRKFRKFYRKISVLESLF